MATANQKYIIDTHTHKRKESKHNTKDSHQVTREKSKTRKEQKTTKIKKKTNEQNGNKYIPINDYFNVNRLNAPNDIE